MSNEAPNLCDYLREARDAWAADMACVVDECMESRRPLPPAYRLLVAGEVAGNVRARRLVRMVEKRLWKMRDERPKVEAMFPPAKGRSRRPPAVRSWRARR